jgi:hypothetical protein
MQKLNASKEVGLEVNIEKTKHMLMPHCQNTGHNCNIKTANRYFQGMAKLKYKGMTPNKSNQHS